MKNRIKNILIESMESIPKNIDSFPVKNLMKVAEFCDSFEEFEHSYIGSINHGYFWHVTSNPDFQISDAIGPKDMSSMAGSESTELGALMVTSHLDLWDSYYNDEKVIRPYAALIDLSNIHPSKIKQVSRGFGNEIYLSPDIARLAKVKAVYTRKRARAIDRQYHKLIPQSWDELRELYDYVKGEKTLNESIENLSEYKPILDSDGMRKFIIYNKLEDSFGELEYHDIGRIAGASDRWELKKLNPKELADYVLEPRMHKPTKTHIRNEVPIIVIKHDEGEYEILDGRHRVAEANYLEEPTILAYVADMTYEDSLNESVKRKRFMYHDTKLENWDGIKKRGLVPQKSESYENDDLKEVIWFFDNKESAYKYSTHADFNDCSVAILKINVSGISLTKDNEGIFYTEETISPSRIQKIDEVEGWND